jgi:hypothetical protein
MEGILKYKFFWEGLIIACIIIGIYLKDDLKNTADYNPVLKTAGIGFIIIAIISFLV